MGHLIINNASQSHTLASHFSRFAHLQQQRFLGSNLQQDDFVKTIKLGLCYTVERLLTSTDDRQFYFEAVLFLSFYSEDDISEQSDEYQQREAVIKILDADLQNNEDPKRRLWSLQVLETKHLKKIIDFTNERKVLIFALLNESLSQATSALNILFNLGLDHDLLNWCWLVLRDSCHPLARSVKEKLINIKDISCTEPIQKLLDEGCNDPYLQPVALELLKNVRWQGLDTFFQMMIWLDSKIPEVRHWASIHLSNSDSKPFFSRNLLSLVRSFLLQVVQERLHNLTTDHSVELIDFEPSIIRLLRGLCLYGYSDTVTTLFTITQPINENTIQEFMKNTDTNSNLCRVVFYRAAIYLRELEFGNIQDNPREIDITQAIERALADTGEPILACFVSISSLREIFKNVSHPLTLWVNKELVQHRLDLFSKPSKIIPLLDKDNINTCLAGTLALYTTDIYSIIAANLAEAIESTDDRVFAKARWNLNAICRSVSTDLSSDIVEVLTRISLGFHYDETSSVVCDTVWLASRRDSYYDNPEKIIRWLNLVASESKSEGAKYCLKYLQNLSIDTLDTLCSVVTDLNQPLIIRQYALLSIQNTIFRNAGCRFRVLFDFDAKYVISKSSWSIVTETLLNSLLDDDLSLQRISAYAIRWIDDRDSSWRCIDHIINILPQKTDPLVRGFLLHSLGRLLYPLRHLALNIFNASIFGSSVLSVLNQPKALLGKEYSF